MACIMTNKPSRAALPRLCALCSVWSFATVNAQTNSQSTFEYHPASLTVQSGFADTFQLTLGGTFGDGPAWQNRVAASVGNIVRQGDSFLLSGFATVDTARHHPDWMASIAYRTRFLNSRGRQLYGTASFERWRLPSVQTGAQDWIAGYGANYAGQIWKLPVTVQSNLWTALHSSLRKGTLLHTQVWVGHALLKSEVLNVTLRHGPQHTYSWNFYGTHGHRIVRYAGALVLSHGATSVEAGYRQQAGLQPNIPDNRLWSVIFSRTF